MADVHGRFSWETNGKVERFFGSMQVKLHMLGSIGEYVEWYNTEKPHMSLDWNRLKTPEQAFYRKWDKRSLNQNHHILVVIDDRYKHETKR